MPAGYRERTAFNNDRFPISHGDITHERENQCFVLNPIPIVISFNDRSTTLNLMPDNHYRYVTCDIVQMESWYAYRVSRLIAHYASAD